MKKTILSIFLFLAFCSTLVSQNVVKSKTASTCAPSRSKVVKKPVDKAATFETSQTKDENIVAVVEKTTPEVSLSTTQKVENTPIKTEVIAVLTLVAHEEFDVLLKKYVTAAGIVNYKGFKQDKAALENYIVWLSDNTPKAETSKNEKLAYWINAYNALTVKLILDNYPLPKITDLDGGKTWDVKRFTLGGKKYSLNDIENTIIRPMGEPRIHFALNCAAKSCPPLANEAFVAEKLNVQLENRTRKFINDTKANYLKGNEIKISNIFNWYGKDFDNVLNFINRYAVVKVKTDVKIGFGEYDWRLNE